MARRLTILKLNKQNRLRSSQQFDYNVVLRSKNQAEVVAAGDARSNAEACGGAIGSDQG